MVDYKYEYLYRIEDITMPDGIDKQLKIETDDNQTVITNTEIESEQFELSESLCSESQLHFGACEASSVTFKIHNIFASMKEKWITITETLEGNTDTPFQFGRYKVFSDVPTADRRYRNVKAYDAMYDIINADVADWYNEVLPEKDSTITLKDFRASFINHFGLQQRDIELINDDMVIEKTVNPSQLSGKNVITAICEINACFGHIDREGKFAYIYLPQMIQGLYPANDLYPDHAPDYLPYQQETGHLYPQNPKGTSIGANGTYISCQYEDWLVKGIKKLQIREKENDIGVVYPDKELQENENSYVIQDNFLVYGKSTEQLKPIAEKIYNQINGIIYRPYDAEVKGNPCLEVGDPIRMSTRYEIIESYILSRTLKGVQGLRDSFSAEGEEYYNEKVNSVQNSIIQLRGKSNTLERTIEETKSTITDVEKGLQTQITQNAESITSEAKRAQTKEEELNGTITRTEETLSSKIDQTAENITLEVSETYETKDNAGENYRSLSSRIEQTVKSITIEVSEDGKTAGITITMEDGETKEATGKIDLSGLVTFHDLENAGETTINGSNITTGTINADLIKSGTISGRAINGGTISGTNISGGTVSGASISGGTIDGTMITSESTNYVCRIYDGEVTSTFFNLISSKSGSGFVPGLRKLNAAQNTVTNSIYLYDDKTIIDKPVYITRGVGGSDLNYEFVGIFVNGRIYSEGATCPAEDDDTSLGTSSYRWSNVYCTKDSISTSDENKKRNIETISEKYEKLFFLLEPLTYMFNSGDRVHIGTTSQRLYKAMEEVGLTDIELGAFCKDVKTKPEKQPSGEVIEVPDLDENGNEQYTYGVRYGEFIMLNTHMIQKLYKEVQDQKKEIDLLKQSVSFLMDKVNEMEERLK